MQAETQSVEGSLESIIPKVGESVANSGEVTHMLIDIQQSSADTLGLIRGVASSTSEQKQAADELSEHVEKISNMVKNTADSISSCKETVAYLDTLSKKLTHNVSYFSLQ